MKKNGATDESVLKYTFKGEEIDASKTAEELSEAYLKTYDLNYKELRGDGGAPRGGQEQGAGGKSTGLLDNYFSEKAAEGKFPTENKN